jgi:hypothetical protein
MTAVDYESPNVLAHGAWVPIRGNELVRRWQPTAATPPAHWHVACDFCGADIGEECRSAAGGVAHLHSRRLEAYRQQQASDLSPTKGGTP